MVVRRKFFPWRLLGVVALLAGLSFAGASQAAKPPPAPKKPAKSALTMAMQYEQAQALRKAFAALAGGNHDYNGHRARAMQEVKAALKHLDGAVMKHGSAQLKQGTTAGKAAVGLVEKVAQNTPTLHERQAGSDAQIRQGGELLAQVRGTLVKQQGIVQKHVDKAIQEVKIALQTR